ncbi:hypothetical protein [Tautonia plasticadhaerens]|uniref:hypothetical protein n=1 Tax=Tautonia plasticadhaerens TaxID=2527974 RepID=UPI0011A10A8A|nr:hypothetical protein [Tautonia plasticadhaerens]
MLTTVLRGVDVDGDTWTLRLVGPGALQVVNQPGADGVTPVPLGQAGLIDTITYQGANPGETRLIGAVQRAPGGDGRVFFENLVSPASAPPGPGIGVGILAIDMPDFWLGDTSPGDTAQVQGMISIPDGVATLNFGGVDTTAFFGTDPAQALPRNNRSDRFTVSLGLPARVGTSIVLDRVVTANQDAAGEDDDDTQDTVTFNVSGRLNVFQANSIEGDPTLDLGDSGIFQGDNPGGTTIISAAPQVAGSQVATGAIGRFRVGGNATNLSVQVSGIEARLTNFFIGGETNKVSISALEGVRTALFGLGMDTVAIQAGEMEQLNANRGAVASSVLVGGNAGSIALGGDVVNTTVLAGYSPASGTTGVPTAGGGGQMTVRVAGDVFDSIFAASVQPFGGVFGSAGDLVVPSGYINAKVEGLIDNSLNPAVSPGAADQAFFAERVRLERGPVVPPGTPGAPYRPRLGPGRTPGVQGLSGGPGSHDYRAVQLLNARRNPAGGA